jgi:hypothetical protein
MQQKLNIMMWWGELPAEAAAQEVALHSEKTGRGRNRVEEEARGMSGRDNGDLQSVCTGKIPSFQITSAHRAFRGHRHAALHPSISSLWVQRRRGSSNLSRRC